MLSIAQYLQGIKRLGNTPAAFKSWLAYATESDDGGLINGLDRHSFHVPRPVFLHPIAMQNRVVIQAVYKYARATRRAKRDGAGWSSDLIVGFSLCESGRCASFNEWFGRTKLVSNHRLSLTGLEPTNALMDMLATIPKEIPGGLWTARPSGFTVSVPGEAGDVVSLRPLSLANQSAFIAHCGDNSTVVHLGDNLGERVLDLVTSSRPKKAPTTLQELAEAPAVTSPAVTQTVSPSPQYARFRDMEREIDELRLTVKRLTGGAEIAKYVLQQINNGSQVPPALVNYAIARIGGGE